MKTRELRVFTERVVGKLKALEDEYDGSLSHIEKIKTLRERALTFLIQYGPYDEFVTVEQLSTALWKIQGIWGGRYPGAGRWHVKDGNAYCPHCAVPYMIDSPEEPEPGKFVCTSCGYHNERR